MANLPQTSQWHNGIYQIEETDPVFGGPTGIANVQSKQLSDRTKWLKDQLAATTSAAALLTKLKTVDGSGTGLDADKLDGHHASHFATQSALDALVGGAPSALNTLAEIADALADDDNAIASIVTQLSGKLGATQTAVNSDQLQGHAASYFMQKLNGRAINANFEKYVTCMDFDDGNIYTGVRAYVRDGVWHINANSQETNPVKMKIGGHTVLTKATGSKRGADYIATITPVPAAGVLTAFAHGLAERPAQYWVVLTCTTSHLGYTPGDEIIIAGSQRDGDSGIAISSRWSTTIETKIGSSGLNIIRQDTGVAHNVAGSANWSLTVKAKL